MTIKYKRTIYILEQYNTKILVDTNKKQRTMLQTFIYYFLNRNIVHYYNMYTNAHPL